jgi:hypothetical protein
MQPWKGYKKPLYLQPGKWQKGVAVFLAFAAVAGAQATHIWVNKIDPCIKGSSTSCTLAKFWFGLLGIPRHQADAQYWGALGLVMMFIAYQIWKYRTKT